MGVWTGLEVLRNEKPGLLKNRKSFEWLHTEDRYFFDFLTGTDKFRKLIKARSALRELLDLAQEGLSDFDTTRRRYLLYP
ncbi:DUF1343 domain-containing protein [candidate division NPL-UPA2 bacterium]|nr:DUF1343 domain-containing protein [candidate division NPL-UPA2 bacterium]